MRLLGNDEKQVFQTMIKLCRNKIKNKLPVKCFYEIKNNFTKL